MYTIAKIKVAIIKPVFRLVIKRFSKTNLIVGNKSILKVGNLLKQKEISNVLIVTSQSLIRLNLIDDVITSLKQEGIKYTIYSNVKPDPTFSAVNEALFVCKENNCQAVIGFGGGSVLDTAKVVAASAGNKYKDPKRLKGMMKVYKKPKPFIAIPTTAGTGSEVTVVAVISDSKSHRKTTIIDPKLIAIDTILDATLTTSLPSSITANTGLDALTHAIEAYISRYAYKETDELSLRAIELIVENLEIAFKEPQDLEARENMLMGAMLAGQAFTRTYVGYVHAFSHNIGGKYGVAHGLANAVLLPHVMQASMEYNKNRFANLADFLNLTSKDDIVEEKAESFINFLFELNDKLSIPKRLEVFDKSSIDEIIKGAFKEAHGTYPVRKYLTYKEAEELLLKVCAN